MNQSSLEAGVWARVHDMIARMAIFYPPPADRTDYSPVNGGRTRADKRRLEKLGLTYGRFEAQASDYAVWLRGHPGFVCAYCDAAPPRRRRQVDHVVPLTRRGRHRCENLVPCCARCNHSKNAKELEGEPTVQAWLTPDAWRTELAETLAR